MPNIVMLNGGLFTSGSGLRGTGSQPGQRTFGYTRQEVIFDPTDTNARGFWIPFDARLGIGGQRVQNFCNVPVKIDWTMAAPDVDDITTDNTLRNIWGPAIASIAVLDTFYCMPPYTGFKATMIPPAAKTNTSLVWAAGVVTVVATAHAFVTGNYVTVAGVTAAGFNGVYSVTVIDANTFTYAMTLTPGTATVVGTSQLKGTGSVVFLGT